MRIGDRHYRSIWLAEDGETVEIIDQTLLPHQFDVAGLKRLEDAAVAIESMQVRGAPLIGATAAYGFALAMNEDASNESIARAAERLERTRPTAINLRWAIERCVKSLDDTPEENRRDTAYRVAGEICDEDAAINESIGDHGLDVIESILARKSRGEPVRILTHCNAGWLATVDWGTALAPIYKAHDRGIAVHVWVDETRPRNQGASITSWELGSHGVAHDVVVDNAGGHLMQKGLVDLVITGTDRVASNGDVCNKIGTYLKALAAHDNGIPFYVALPSPTIDWSLESGEQIPIEERSAEEVTHIWGRDDEGKRRRVRLTPDSASARNYGFDVTPSRLISGLVTERGVCDATSKGLASLFPETVRTHR
ncbi:MAG: S-methyl-5-thioribose-1-phosphate isomerase [Thermoanaerobaculia bacterium]|nr:S-methyl-5-thioribose-1-phosphate isomerase [Thermoanaerobaculia bacterium]